MTRDTSTHGPADSTITDLLMIKEAPLLAGVVTVVAQPFGQLRAHYGDILPDWTPLLVAATVSALIAFHYVKFVRKLPTPQAIYIVPLVMLIIFSGSIGANNLVDAASRGSTATEASGGSSEREAALRTQLKRAEEQLRLEQDKGRLLRQALELDPQGTAPAASTPGAMGMLPDFFIASAHAQPTAEPRRPREPGRSTSPSPTSRDPELLKRLQELDQKTQQLQSERDKIKEEEEARKQRQSPAQRSLWKTW